MPRDIPDTLKLETEPAKRLREQQRGFDLFRREYNDERPHEALGGRTPASVYQPSRQHYPRPLICPADGQWGHQCRADKQGYIRWNRHRVFIASPLAYENITLSPCLDSSRWEVSFGPILLGSIDETDLSQGLILPPKKRKRPPLSTTSLVPDH